MTNAGRRTLGFTLMEMILVIIILGVVATGVTSFLRFGTTIFIDVAGREQLLNSARFVVERLNRELRSALPNSVRTRQLNDAQCVEFVPIVASTYYVELPVLPTTATTISAFRPEGYVASANQRAVVYPLSTAEVYDLSNDKNHGISSVSIAVPPMPSTITLSSAEGFAQHSPANRVFIVSTPVSYCVFGGDVSRHSDYGYFVNQSLSAADIGTGTLMAEALVNNLNDASQQPFVVIAPTLARNATVSILLMFANNDEQIVFNNEVHIPNAP